MNWSVRVSGVKNVYTTGKRRNVPYTSEFWENESFSKAWPYFSPKIALSKYALWTGARFSKVPEISNPEKLSRFVGRV